jgi:hypothetical protein
MWSIEMDTKQQWEIEYEKQFGAGDAHTRRAFEQGWHMALSSLLERFRDDYYDQEGD